MTLGSKMTLKNLDLKIKEGSFVCIIGVGACGKSSLLSSVFGDLIYVSDNTIDKLGGVDAMKTGNELIKL